MGCKLNFVKKTRPYKKRHVGKVLEVFEPRNSSLMKLHTCNLQLETVSFSLKDERPNCIII